MIGKCAKCKSDNLDYETNVDGEENGFIYYPYTCGNCEHEGKEWYSIEYTETE